jgi:hypothetical protein
MPDFINRLRDGNTCASIDEAQQPWPARAKDRTTKKTAVELGEK